MAKQKAKRAVKRAVKKSNKFLYWSIGLLVAALALFVIYLALPSNPANNKIATDIYSEIYNKFPCSSNEGLVLGNKNASVTIVEYSDFSCPFCSAAVGLNNEVVNVLKSRVSGWEAPFPNIIESYVKTGEAKIIFNYFPGHGAGLASHAVGLALSEQCLFWQFHDLAFANQADAGNITKMKALAESLGANMTKLEAYLSNTTRINEILNEEMQEGIARGVQGTPSFFINDKLIAGAQPFAEFKKLVDAELAKI